MSREQDYVLSVQFNTLMSSYHPKWFFFFDNDDEKERPRNRFEQKKKFIYQWVAIPFENWCWEKEHLGTFFICWRILWWDPFYRHGFHDEKKNSLNYNQLTHILFLFTLNKFNLFVFIFINSLAWFTTLWAFPTLLLHFFFQFQSKTCNILYHYTILL